MFQTISDCYQIELDSLSKKDCIVTQTILADAQKS